MIGKESFKNDNKPPLTPPDFLFPIVWTILLWVTYNFNDKMGNICSLFKYWFSGVSVGHLNLANAKISSQNKKSLLNFFKNCGFGQRP